VLAATSAVSANSNESFSLLHQGDQQHARGDEGNMILRSLDARMYTFPSIGVGGHHLGECADVGRGGCNSSMRQ